MQDLKRPLILLGVLLCIILIAMLWSMVNTGTTQAPAQGERIAAPDFIPGPPPPEIIAMLEESKGFKVLISYTDGGFEPAAAVIEVGDAVRFTNNSSKDLWVAAAGSSEDPVYPGTSECGASSLDTCMVLEPREFWEFTFDQSGTWTFQNNLDKGQTGAVLVQVQ